MSGYRHKRTVNDPLERKRRIRQAFEIFRAAKSPIADTTLAGGEAMGLDSSDGNQNPSPFTIDNNRTDVKSQGAKSCSTLSRFFSQPTTNGQVSLFDLEAGND